MRKQTMANLISSIIAAGMSISLGAYVSRERTMIELKERELRDHQENLQGINFCVQYERQLTGLRAQLRTFTRDAGIPKYQRTIT